MAKPFKTLDDMGDITGKVVQRVPNNSRTIATEGLPAGCYLLRSEDTVEPRSCRMVKE